MDKVGRAGPRGFAFLRLGVQSDEDEGEMEGGEDEDYEYDDPLEEYDDALDRCGRNGCLGSCFFEDSL